MTTFYYEAPQAHAVYLMGDFNHWNPTSHPMRRRADGSWVVAVPLDCGSHYYKFLVDGESVLDPHAMYVSKEGQRVSFVAVD